MHCMKRSGRMNYCKAEEWITAKRKCLARNNEINTTMQTHKFIITSQTCVPCETSQTYHKYFINFFALYHIRMSLSYGLRIQSMHFYDGFVGSISTSTVIYSMMHKKLYNMLVSIHEYFIWCMSWIARYTCMVTSVIKLSPCSYSI